ncbi:MAG: hypothetical protein HOO96_26370 [Polyangiaceae bacterium]|nr:hypothetical protein [Polyangiaceae bacterium]
MYLQRRFALPLLLMLAACSSTESGPVVVTGDSAEIGPKGGELKGALEGSFAGFSIKIPAGALKDTVKVSFVGISDDTPLPDTAERVGPQIAIQPAGTQLAMPAELTVPLDPERLESYDGTPETCKVWARKGDGWERVEALRHGLGSVTVPIRTFATAAAGVTFVPTAACKGCTPAPVADSGPACDALSATYCIVKLPRPENMTFLDEFASLTVAGTKVYWAAVVDGNPTVLRYDLQNPVGSAFVYPSWAGAASGPTSTRGRVAVVSENEVWASFAGYGNLRFRAGAPAEAYDVPPTVQPAGVSTDGVGRLLRFSRQSVGSNKIDVRIADGLSTETKFLFNYAAVIPGSNPLEANPPENIVAAGNASTFRLRSLHRGIGRGFEGGDPVALSLGFWGVQFHMPGSTLGTILDNDTKTFGPAIFGNAAVQVSGAGTQYTRFDDQNNPTTTGGFPVAVRDIAQRGDLFAIASGRPEFYVVNAGNALTVTGLAIDGVSPANLSPWRLAPTFLAGNPLLLVTRGPVIKKGEFYLIRAK